MKEIKLKSGKEEYTLTMSRASVRYSEEVLGFDINTAGMKVLSSTSKLFNTAFFAKHGILPLEETDAIFEKTSNKESLIKVLQEMYMEVINAFIAEDEGGGKNNTWEIVQ